jgi:hypothetical protein
LPNGTWNIPLRLDVKGSLNLHYNLVEVGLMSDSKKGPVHFTVQYWDNENQALYFYDGMENSGHAKLITGWR